MASTEPASNPLSEAAIWAAALQKYAESNLELATEFRKSRRLTSWHFAIAIGVFLIGIAVAIMLIFVLFNEGDTHKTLGIVEGVTSPKAQAQAAQAEQQVINQITRSIVACEDNHIDRVIATLFHTAIPPRIASCPTDALPKATVSKVTQKAPVHVAAPVFTHPFFLTSTTLAMPIAAKHNKKAPHHGKPSTKKGAP